MEATHIHVARATRTPPVKTSAVEGSPASVGQWEIFEWSKRVPAGGPDARTSAVFTHASETLRVDGFFDGQGNWRVRFMPHLVGEWRYRIHSTLTELDGSRGSFTCEPPDPGVHGPVRVADTHHFRYADGTPFWPFGTTCYAWTHQSAELRRLTLATLRGSPFNKVRMCVFPKRYVYNSDEPELHAFKRRDDGSLDFDHLEPAFFQHFEARVAELRSLDIEADVILFHPYDVWGYQGMTAEQDERYVRHVVARLGAFCNVWWSVANEWDLMDKAEERWHRLVSLIADADPYGHLVSIHHAERMFDHTHPGITHVSLQSWDVKRTREWRGTFGRPVVNDEPEYEGDIPLPWGIISPRELVHRFWTVLLNGGYAGHGETYLQRDEVLWWSKGGRLHGESAPRIAFLRSLIEQTGGPLEPLEASWVWTRISAARASGTWFYYFGEHQPRRWTYGLPTQKGEYEVDLIDPWAMTVSAIDPGPAPHPSGLPGAHEESLPAFSVDLPARPYLALRIRRL